MIRKRNIWILGGTGFIGKALVRHLSLNPENRLNLLVHKNTPYKTLESCNIFSGDLENFDREWFECYPPEIVFHSARMGGSHIITRALASWRGALANRKLLRYVAGLKNHPVIVYVSGSLVYGHQETGHHAVEHAGIKPVSYAKYYYRAEKPFSEAQKNRLADIRFARPGWIVGPGSWFMAFYWQHFLLTGKVPLYGNGNQLMSLVDLDDCARQISDLSLNGSSYQNLNVFSGEPVSQRSFAEALAALLNVPVQPVSLSELRHRDSRTVAEAFGSSIPLSTLYPSTVNQRNQQFRNITAILAHTLSFLNTSRTYSPNLHRKVLLAI